MARGKAAVQKMTDFYIKSLKAAEKVYVRTDGNGLYVRVWPNGKKSFMTVYTFDGRQRWYTLGDCEKLGLKRANEKLREVKRMVENGTDPLERKQEDIAASIADPSVRDFIKVYLEQYAAKHKSERSAKEDERILNNDIDRVWGKRKLKNIKRPDVVSLLDSIANRGAPIMANRTLAVVRKMFNVAVKRGVVEVSPCQLIDPPGGNEKDRRKDRYLSEDEIRSFLAFAESNFTETFKRLFQLILATAQRPGEVVAMRWEEIEGEWWTIPKEKTKNGSVHRVYLNEFAQEILGIPKKKGFVFPARKGKISTHVNAISQALRKKLDLWLEARTKEGSPSKSFTPHDLRRTAATHMGALKVPELTISKILNHVDGGVTSIYNRHGYDDEKQVALAAWGRKLQNIIHPKEKCNVIPMVR